jgi:hypothetical protein
MKILRIVHGITSVNGQLTNGVIDSEVPDDYAFGVMIQQVKAQGYFFNGVFMIPWEWIMHIALLTSEQYSAMHTQGMAKN